MQTLQNRETLVNLIRLQSTGMGWGAVFERGVMGGGVSDYYINPEKSLRVGGGVAVANHRLYAQPMSGYTLVLSCMRSPVECKIRCTSACVCVCVLQLDFVPCLYFSCFLCA